MDNKQFPVSAVVRFKARQSNGLIDHIQGVVVGHRFGMNIVSKRLWSGRIKYFHLPDDKLTEVIKAMPAELVEATHQFYDAIERSLGYKPKRRTLK